MILKVGCSSMFVFYAVYIVLNSSGGRKIHLKKNMIESLNQNADLFVDHLQRQLKFLFFCQRNLLVIVTCSLTKMI